MRVQYCLSDLQNADDSFRIEISCIYFACHGIAWHPPTPRNLIWFPFIIESIHDIHRYLSLSHFAIYWKKKNARLSRLLAHQMQIHIVSRWRWMQFAQINELYGFISIETFWDKVGEMKRNECARKWSIWILRNESQRATEHWYGNECKKACRQKRSNHMHMVIICLCIYFVFVAFRMIYISIKM